MQPIPADYLMGAACWAGLLFFGLLALLGWRRRARTRGRTPVVAHAGLALWMALVVVTFAEFASALFADWSDAFNTTTISQRWFARHIEAQKNAAGLRDAHEFEPQLPPGVQRFAFFGDSFTIGHGVAQREDRFSDRLAAYLDEALPGRFHVDNFGVPGFGIREVDARIRGLIAADVQLEHAVYVFTPNDIENHHPGTLRIIRAIRGSESTGWFLQRTYLLNWLHVRTLQARGAGTGDYFAELVRAYESPAWGRLAEELSQLWAYCRAHRVAPRFVVFPFVHELGPDYSFRPAHAKLMALAEREGVPALDLEPVLAAHAEGRGAGELVVNRFDPHPNETAHALAARAMARAWLHELRAREVRRAQPERRRVR